MTNTHKLFDMKAPDELMKDLSSQLTWNSGDALLYEAARAYRIWVLARLRIWESATGTDVYRRIKALPLSAQQRLLLAPQFFFLLQQTTTPDQQALAAVNSYIDVEELLAGGSGSIKEPRWSALGDVCLAPGSSNSGVQRLYEAPRVRNIIVDTRSPHIGTEMLEEWGRIVPCSDVESSEFYRKIVDALAFIEQTSSAALETIDSVGWVILGVNTVENPQLAQGGSMNSMIGGIVFTNGHLEAWTRERLADSLVHEAIHSLIYKLELVVPLYTDYSSALSAKAKSPWSGRSLPLPSFVHACFVWYGLWRFWGLDKTEAGKTYYTRSQKGFLDRCPLDGLSTEDRELIQPYVCSAIEGFYRSVNSYGIRSACVASNLSSVR